MNVTRTIGFNGLGEFSVIIYFEDGTADSIGPFATGEEAAAAIYSLEQVDIAESDAESAEWDADMDALRWAENGGYASGMARPVNNILRGTLVEWEDVPF